MSSPHIRYRRIEEVDAGRAPKHVKLINSPQVFFIVVALESFRRLGREYDRALKKNYAAQQQSIRDSLGKDGEEVALAPFRFDPFPAVPKS